MKPQLEDVLMLYRQAANGDPDALFFLQFFHEYVHGIDDFIDLKLQDPQKFLSLLITANMVYSTPFYTRHAEKLHLVVCQITNAFADSVVWQEDKTEWKRQWADTLRFAGNEMVTTVAMICGGFEHMRSLSLVLKDTAWMCHHSDDGKPI